MAFGNWRDHFQKGFHASLTLTLLLDFREINKLYFFRSIFFFFFRYKPPITSSSTSPNLPETADEITQELQKQDSLLNQIHAEMNAGFVSKKREEQLWEVQRIITQLKVSLMCILNLLSCIDYYYWCLFVSILTIGILFLQRKLRSFEKKQDSTQKSMDDTVDGETSFSNEIQFSKAKSICSDDESMKTAVLSTGSATNTETKTTPQVRETFKLFDPFYLRETYILNSVYFFAGHPRNLNFGKSNKRSSPQKSARSSRR